MYPKARIDALTDGIYAVAMTLLVLDIRLPEDFRPQDDAELIKGLMDLAPRLFPYAISFMVLGGRWLANVGDRGESGPVPRRYTKWWLINLLLVTCFPFTTVVMGRYPHSAPAIWLYSGTMLLMAAISFRMMLLMPGTHSEPVMRERRIEFAGLVTASAMAIVWSIWSPQQALLWYLTILVFRRASNLVLKKPA
jgi:TMEM175 potassium channel family protein